MLDPFTFWTRTMSAALDMSKTGMRAAETMQASNDVIAARSGTIRDAIGSPLTADYGELSRMAPEKAEAFSKAGVAILNQSWGMYNAWLTEAQNVGAMMLRGRAPTFAELPGFWSRGAAYALRSMEDGAKLWRVALAPVHKTATQNARRLRTSRPH